MDRPDYVVRATRLTAAGHTRVTVVDMRGRVAHVTIRRDHYPAADVHTLVLDRLGRLPEPKRSGP